MATWFCEYEHVLKVSKLTIALLCVVCRSKWPLGIRANGHLLLNSEKVFIYVADFIYLFIVHSSWFRESKAKTIVKYFLM